MTDVKITDPALVTTLTGSDVPLAIRTPEGDLLGYFTPVLNSRYERTESETPMEEIRRRAADRTSKTYTMDEVMAVVRGHK